MDYQGGGGGGGGGLDKKLLLSQQFKYSMRLFEAKNVNFAKMLLALIRLESLNTEFIGKGLNCRIPAESAQSAASLAHHFFQLREF